MTVAELTIGDTFYFIEWPHAFFTYAGLWEKPGVIRKSARCIPIGKLYAKYFSLKKEVVLIKKQNQ